MSIIVWVILFLVLISFFSSFIFDLAYLIWVIWGALSLLIDSMCYLGVSNSFKVLAIGLVPSLLILKLVLVIYNAFWKHN